RVVSSPPQYVSGGDARIEVRVPSGMQNKVELYLNGRRISANLKPTRAGSDRLQAVISGLAQGENRLEALIKGRWDRDVIKLINYPITGPMFSGPQQHPFVCTTTQGAVGRQPVVESATPPGTRVFDSAGNVIGYSRDCSIETFVTYLYRTTANTWANWPADGSRPADLAQVTLPDGRTVDFVVRREVGSINRFLYSFAMLAPPGESAGKPDLSRWNGRL